MLILFVKYITIIDFSVIERFSLMKNLLCLLIENIMSKSIITTCYHYLNTVISNQLLICFRTGYYRHSPSTKLPSILHVSHLC
jgi:hypothetical protein